MWGQKSNLHNFLVFGCKPQVHIPHTFREKLDPKTKDCIFFGYMEGIKVGVFKPVAIGKRFVSHNAIAGSVRLNSKPIARSSLGYQGKRGTAKVSLEQPKEDEHEKKL